MPPKKDSSIHPAAKPARKTTLPKEAFAQETLKMYMKFADAIVQDQRKVKQLAVEAAKKLRTNEESFKGAFKDIKALIRLLKAWSKNECTCVQPESVALATAALTYFTAPTYQLLGLPRLKEWGEDTAIIELVTSTISADMEKFKEWEKNNKKPRQM